MHGLYGFYVHTYIHVCPFPLVRLFIISRLTCDVFCQSQKGSGAYIPHHASPAVAASAAAAREAAAAGNGEIMPATSLFVRKV